jgi:hypothetical protein
MIHRLFFVAACALTVLSGLSGCAFPVSPRSGSSQVNNGVWVGGGDDPLRLFVSAGHNQLIQRIGDLTASDIEKLEPLFPSFRPARDWFVANRDALVAEVATLKIEWVNIDRLNCGQTTFERGAVVTLSVPVCKESVRDNSTAAIMLLHEALHHFGITDEEQADRWADLLFQAGHSTTATSWCDLDPFTRAFAQRLAGDWIIDSSLAQEMESSDQKPGLSLTIKEQPDVLKRFPGLAGTCALFAGLIRFERPGTPPTDNLALMVLKTGLVHLALFIEGAHEDGSPDFESFSLSLAPSNNPVKDRLFVGDDHPEGMLPMKRLSSGTGIETVNQENTGR